MSTEPVALPIEERIYLNVLETLGRISTAAGYLNDSIVEESVQGGNPPLRDGLLLVEPSTKFPQSGGPVMFEEFLLVVGVKGHVIERADSTIPVRQRLLSLAADVRRALLEDRHRGQLAVNTEFDGDELYEHDKPPCVIVWPKIRFRHRVGDPYRRT